MAVHSIDGEVVSDLRCSCCDHDTAPTPIEARWGSVVVVPASAAQGRAVTAQWGSTVVVVMDDWTPDEIDAAVSLAHRTAQEYNKSTPL